MVFEIELLYLIAMIATFVILLLVAKLPSGLALMCSAVVGALLYGIISGEATAFNPRHLVEGAFGYFDTILVIITAMIFIEGLSRSGALEYLSVSSVKLFKKFPTILLIVFMIMLMLPGMITGSSLSAVISIGAIVSPIMIKMGIPKGKTAAIVAFGAIYGMIAPPINIPVMAICDVCDIPFNGFTVPLLLLTVPVAIFSVIFLSRDLVGGIKDLLTGKNYIKQHNLVEDIIVIALFGAYVAAMFGISIATKKEAYNIIAISSLVLFIFIVLYVLLAKPYSTKIDLASMKEEFNFDIMKQLNFTCLIPVIVLVALFILQQILPNQIGILGTPLLFIIAYLLSIFVGRKTRVISVVKSGVEKSFGPMALLMGVGMFVQIMTLNGVRGWFVVNALILPDIWQYVAIIVAVPVFGGISSFGSTSILGGPFVMALLKCSPIVVASALSLIAGLGEFLPPTAMSATFSGKQVGINQPLKVTKEAIFPMIITLIWSMIFIIVIGPVW